MMISNAMGSQKNSQSDVNALAGLGTAGLSGLLGKGAQKKLTELLPLMQMLMEKVGCQQQDQGWGGHEGGHHGGHHQHGGICPSSRTSVAAAPSRSRAASPTIPPSSASSDRYARHHNPPR